MSVHVLGYLAHHNPARVMNGVAMVIAVVGGWLLQAARRRTMADLGQLSGRADAARQRPLLEAAMFLVNRSYFRFGVALLMLALLVSWLSTRLH